MRLTREEALKRVQDECKWHSSSNAKMAESIADLLLSVQAETERRVVEKCCEIVVPWTATTGDHWGPCARSIIEEIRAAFPGEEAK